MAEFTWAALATNGRVAAVASGRRAESAAIDDPALGPAVAIYDDTNRTRRGLYLSLGVILTGLLGMYMGAGDLSGKDTLLAVAFLGGGAFLVAYGLRGGYGGVARLRAPVRLVVGKRGFAYASGPGPITWDEVASVDIEKSSTGPREGTLVVELSRPETFASRHAPSPRSRMKLGAQEGRLDVGGATIMPIDAVRALMRRRLAEAGGKPAAAAAALAPVRAPAVAARARRKRPSPKR